MAGANFALQYDLLNDFEPVALLSTGPYVLTARKTMQANNLKGLIAWLKANPDKATLGHSGIGNGENIAGEFTHGAASATANHAHARKACRGRRPEKPIMRAGSCRSTIGWPARHRCRICARSRAYRRRR
jgi:hypothetical protein